MTPQTNEQTVVCNELDEAIKHLRRIFDWLKTYGDEINMSALAALNNPLWDAEKFLNQHYNETD